MHSLVSPVCNENDIKGNYLHVSAQCIHDNSFIPIKIRRLYEFYVQNERTNWNLSRKFNAGDLYTSRRNVLETIPFSPLCCFLMRKICKGAPTRSEYRLNMIYISLKKKRYIIYIFTFTQICKKDLFLTGEPHPRIPIVINFFSRFNNFWINLTANSRGISSNHDDESPFLRFLPTLSLWGEQYRLLCFFSY